MLSLRPPSPSPPSPRPPPLTCSLSASSILSSPYLPLLSSRHILSLLVVKVGTTSTPAALLGDAEEGGGEGRSGNGGNEGVRCEDEEVE